jgi:hypothetical protein
MLAAASHKAALHPAALPRLRRCRDFKPGSCLLNGLQRAAPQRRQNRSTGTAQAGSLAVPLSSCIPVLPQAAQQALQGQYRQQYQQQYHAMEGFQVPFLSSVPLNSAAFSQRQQQQQEQEQEQRQRHMQHPLRRQQQQQHQHGSPAGQATFLREGEEGRGAASVPRARAPAAARLDSMPLSPFELFSAALPTMVGAVGSSLCLWWSWAIFEPAVSSSPAIALHFKPCFENASFLIQLSCVCGADLCCALSFPFCRARTPRCLSGRA